MALVRGKQRGSSNGFKAVLLVICAIVVGLAELCAQESPAQRTSLPQDPKALLRDWEVAKDRRHARLVACDG